MSDKTYTYKHNEGIKNLRVNDQLHTQLKVHCVLEGLKMGEVVNQLIVDYLKSQKK